MAITAFNWYPLATPTSFSDDGSARTVERSAQIITDDPSDGELLIASDGRVPRYGEALEEEPALTVRNRRLERQSDSFLHWRLTVEYSDAAKDSEEDRQKEAKALEPNPLLREAIIEWEGVPREVAIWRDRLGTPIVNSAGDAFDPPITVVVYDTVAVVTKNVASVPVWLLDYQGAVNDNTFEVDGVTAEVGSCLMGPIRISGKQTENGFTFRTLQMPLHFRSRRDLVTGETEAPEAWKLEILDQGLRYKSGTNRKNIMDDSTPPQPVTTPVPLDGNGGKIANPSASNLSYLTFDIHKRRNFSLLPLS